jgi:adenylate cyclase
MATVEGTFLFADIAGFTALTEAHGDEEAAQLVDRFCGEVGALLPGFGGEKVKSIGDAVLLRMAEPRAAVALGLRLAHGMLGNHGAPTIRVGMHHGSAVCRNDDYFGTTVNLAARVSALAGGGEVLLTAATGAAAGELDGVVYEARGRHELKGIADAVEIVAAVPLAADDTAVRAIDPVCHMAVSPDRAAGRLVFEDVAYHFCTLECAGTFARDPRRYARHRPGA